MDSVSRGFIAAVGFRPLIYFFFAGCVVDSGDGTTNIIPVVCSPGQKCLNKIPKMKLVQKICQKDRPLCQKP